MDRRLLVIDVQDCFANSKNVCMRVQFRRLDKDKSLRESSLAEVEGKTAPRRSPFIGHERGLCGLLRMKEVEDLLKEV